MAKVGPVKLLRKISFCFLRLSLNFSHLSAFVSFSVSLFLLASFTSPSCPLVLSLSLFVSCPASSSSSLARKWQNSFLHVLVGLGDAAVVWRPLNRMLRPQSSDCTVHVLVAVGFHLAVVTLSQTDFSGLFAIYSTETASVLGSLCTPEPRSFHVRVVKRVVNSVFGIRTVRCEPRAVRTCHSLHSSISHPGISPV